MIGFIERLFHGLFVEDEPKSPNPLGLTQLKAEEKIILRRFIQSRDFAAQEIIYEAQTPPTAIYFLMKGSVGLYVPVESHNEERVQYLSAGRWFGLSALTPNDIRPFTARALEPANAVALLKRDFEMLLTLSPQLANRILLSVARDLFFSLSELNSEHARLMSRLAKSNIVV